MLRSDRDEIRSYTIACVAYPPVIRDFVVYMSTHIGCGRHIHVYVGGRRSGALLIVQRMFIRRLAPVRH